MESEKIGTYCGDEGLARSDEGLSKDQLESMEINVKGSTEMRGAELIIAGVLFTNFMLINLRI